MGLRCEIPYLHTDFQRDIMNLSKLHMERLVLETQMIGVMICVFFVSCVICGMSIEIYKWRLELWQKQNKSLRAQLMDKRR